MFAALGFFRDVVDRCWKSPSAASLIGSLLVVDHFVPPLYGERLRESSCGKVP